MSNPQLSLTLRTSGLERALRRSPKILTKHLRPALERSALEIGRSARRNAPKALSTLTHSINHFMSIDGLAAHVQAGVEYAGGVEHGTPSGRMPSTEEILAWIQVKGIEPDIPGTSDDSLAFLIRRKIYRDGTSAQPFMLPALESHTGSAQRRIDKAISAALREIG